MEHTNSRIINKGVNMKTSHEKETENDLRGYVQEYCESSSIQGLSYMIKSSTWIERFWWIIIFILGIAGSCWMVYKITDKWITTPVLVSLATREDIIDGIPFPAVTICPETKISRKYLNYTDVLVARNNFEMNENILFDAMAAVCLPENHLYFSPHLSRSINYAEFFQAHKAVDLDYSYCVWMGQEKNCSEILTPILTDQGLCYSFNMYDVRDIYSDLNTMNYYEKQSNRRRDWNPDTGFSDAADLENMYPRRALLNGAQSSLVVVLLTDKEDIDYACRDFSTQGMRVTLHTASRIPRLGQVFFSVGLDRLTTVSVNPTVTETSDKIRNYSPEKRGCFFGYERNLKYFRFYSQSSCNFECWTNYTISKCGCVDFYMPRDSETKDCNLEKRFCLENARVTYNADILRERLNKGKKGQGNATTICNCMPLCSDLTYNAEVSTSEWIFNDEDEVFVDGMREAMSRNRASAIKIFFKDMYFLPNRRDELYGTSDMISNIGGALGLFTGFSLVSLAEIIYFMSVKLIENYRRYNHWAGPRIMVVQE
ncbi:pickpocket protein 28-like [Harmonia axyridis]|uniref:pickpocket protein 28-like n=1 Tax=Harmonia axyridis TaxID=115357 RepID=UPI001E2792F1|nr:pickpocket protein 28-like [Harmonia axyridis]